MLSTSLSQVPVLLTQRVVDAYQVVRSKFGPSYQPLSQDGRVIAPIEGKSSEGGFLASRRVKFLAWSFGIVLFCAAILSYPSWSGSTQSITESTPEQTITPPLRTSITKDQYISAVVEAPVAGLFDPEPIREKCSNTKFQEGLVWHCDNLSGGVGNMVSMFLNCVRYAMEAGATTLILPRIDPRSDNLINFGEDPAIDLSNVFDVDYFLESWKSACPQMRAVVSDSELSNLPDIKEAPHLSPAQVKKFPRRKYLVVDPAGWREAFDAWMVKTQKFTKMTAETPVRIWQGRVMFQWNREVHSVKFANAFPRLFRFPQKTQRLAGEVLWSLEQKMGSPAVSDVILSTTRESSQRANSLEPGRLVPNAFLGAHLRVAADAVNAKWPGYEAQAPAFIAEAKQRNISNIYLATGSAEHRTRFRKDAEIEGLNVFVKEDLLDEEQLKELQSWTWDQQALVDFDVLMHSSYFYGAVRSSFSWWLAIRRNTLPDAGKRIGTDTDFIKDEKRKDEFRDELSAVVGRYCCINPEGIWS